MTSTELAYQYLQHLRKRPSDILIMLALCTAVTLLRPLFLAYSNAYSATLLNNARQRLIILLSSKYYIFHPDLDVPRPLSCRNEPDIKLTRPLDIKPLFEGGYRILLDRIPDIRFITTILGCFLRHLAFSHHFIYPTPSPPTQVLISLFSPAPLID